MLGVPTSPQTSLTASNGGPRKVGLTSGMGQCLTSGNEWSDVDHQGAPMYPQQQSETDVTSGIGDSNSRIGRRRRVPENTPVIKKIIRRERRNPRSQRAHACGVNNAFRRDTSKEPLEALRPIRVAFQG